METVEQALARAVAAEERLRSQTLLRAEAEHRMKTSLAVIAGWATTLDDRWDLLDDGNRREGIAIIRRASEQLGEQAARLLDDARAELRALELDAVPFDLDAVLALTTVALRGVSRAHAVDHLPAGGPVPVHADPGAVQQVLEQLVENAVKYSPAGSRVTVASRAVGDRVVLEVVDEGVGVPDDLDVFAPFLRGDAATAVPGVGLGLYIARNLCRAMGGEVSARRNAGSGSTFTVELPGAG